MPYKKSHCKHYSAGCCMSKLYSPLWHLFNLLVCLGTKGATCTFIHDASRAPPPAPIVTFKLNATTCSEAELARWWSDPSFGPPPSHPLVRSSELLLFHLRFFTHRAHK
jgi:hypothetical protein